MTRPAAWVKATLEVANLNEEQVANRVKKRVSTIYNWQKKGIEYLVRAAALVDAVPAASPGAA